MPTYRIWIVIILGLTVMIPGLIVFNQIPSPVPQARISFATALKEVRSLYPDAQVLTVVPDVYNRTASYRYRLRMPDGHLWHIYLDAKTDHILAKDPIIGPAPGSSPIAPLTSRQHALDIAYRAVGGGKIATVKTNKEDHGRIYIVELMLSNGQYAKVQVDPKTAKVLSLKVEKVDH
jgi:uncharacterized membrane protein YkoI